MDMTIIIQWYILTARESYCKGRYFLFEELPPDTPVETA